MLTRKRFVDTPMFAAQNCTYIHAVGGICCEIGLRLQSDSTQCNPREVCEEQGAGENDRITNECRSSEREGKYGTHVSHSDGEKEEKDPEVQVKLLARGFTLAGYPKREEPG